MLRFPRRSLRGGLQRLGIIGLVVTSIIIAPISNGGGSAIAKEKASLALVNLTPQRWQVAQGVAKELGDWVDGWAREPVVAAALMGKPAAASLPSGQVVTKLGRLLATLRQQGALDQKALGELGKLLGVDYVLVLKIPAGGLAAHLFSVRRRALAPERFRSEHRRGSALRQYVVSQVAAPVTTSGPWHSGIWQRFKKRWWVWAIVAGLGAVTLGVALGTGQGDSGTLNVHIHR